MRCYNLFFESHAVVARICVLFCGILPVCVLFFRILSSFMPFWCIIFFLVYP